MTKHIALAVIGLLLSLSTFAIGPITGKTNGCIGTTSTLKDSTTTGGIWTSSNTSVATIGSSSGIVTSISIGTTTITYTLGTFVTTTFTVGGTAPAPISGTTSFCTGITSTLTSTTPGGTWSSSNPFVATVGSSTGIVTGVNAGLSTISYTIGTCSEVAVVNISSGPAVIINWATTLCAGGTITLYDSLGSTSGTWASSNTAVASVSGGVVTGITAGTVTISYSLAGTCGTTTATRNLTVLSSTSPGTITGPSAITVGTTATLSESVSGGSWSSSNTAVVNVHPLTGVISATAIGTATITYTISGCSGIAFATMPITVIALNGISGDVLFTGVPYYGTVRVWLIKYNPATLDLRAVDSVNVNCTSGSSISYQFIGSATDSFRVKAATMDTPILTTGYIPTYHNSSFYWYGATVIYHTFGTSDINKNITMAYGTVTPGPGFVGGNVTTGANKGTASTPAIGLRIFLTDAAGNLVRYTKTDALGSYSFGSLPLGSYTVFPEELNYTTTPYTGINLTSSTTSMMAASFVQHTVSKTITPIPASIPSLSNTNSPLAIYPNPTNGKTTIQWNVAVSETGNISVTDVTGREVYTSAIELTTGNGSKQVDLSALNGGIYIIKVTSATVTYSNKIEVVK